MPREFKLTRRVEFHETDMAGIVHFTHFFRYMEAAEHAFFRSLGLSIVTTQIQPPVGWPRVHASCDYQSPLRFEDEVEIHLTLTEIKSRSLTYQFHFHKLTPTVPVATGRLTTVCVTRDPSGHMRATPIPPEVLRLLQTP